MAAAVENLTRLTARTRPHHIAVMMTPTERRRALRRYAAQLLMMQAGIERSTRQLTSAKRLYGPNLPRHVAREIKAALPKVPTAPSFDHPGWRTWIRRAIEGGHTDH